MKFTTGALFVSLALAAPAPSPDAEAAAGVSKRQQGAVAITESYSFALTLPQFTAKRNARDPASLIWDSDGCTSSPDNPLGFPFVPACNRHDFGYHNFRAQSRFTVSNKKRIDDQFHKDLDFQCEGRNTLGLCTALADVYYWAVRAFGGDDATPDAQGIQALSDDGEVRAAEQVAAEATYREKLEIYEGLLAEARAQGLVPASK